MNSTGNIDRKGYSSTYISSKINYSVYNMAITKLYFIVLAVSCYAYDIPMPKIYVIGYVAF